MGVCREVRKGCRAQSLYGKVDFAEVPLSGLSEAFDVLLESSVQILPLLMPKTLFGI